jgi:hypothetical protein
MPYKGLHLFAPPKLVRLWRSGQIWWIKLISQENTMKLRKLLLMLFFIICASLADSGGKSLANRNNGYTLIPRGATPQNNTVELNLSYDLAVHGETRRLSLIVALPQTMQNRQKILGIMYSPEPTRLFGGNGNRYAEFVFINPEQKIKVKINIKAELIRYDLFTAREKLERDYDESSELRDFLKQEKYIEKNDPKIKEIAQGIEGQTEVDIVKKIYNYVADNIEYTVHGRSDWGAVKALQKKKGDCSEYADLFVALCRAKKIPARVATGYIVRSSAVSSKHNWVEVYLKDFGWVPFDPAWGDVKNTIFRDMAFSRLSPIYLYLSYVRNDELLRNYQFCAYKYWGDSVVLKDSIKFRPLVTGFPPSRE